MARHRRRYHNAYWGTYHVSKRDQLSRQFGGIDEDIEAAFFQLPFNSRESLFVAYGRRHRKGAETYARKTFPEWKSGLRRLSGQTAERLLELVPSYLSTEERFKLIKKLRAYHFGKASCSVTASPDSWKETVVPIINDVVKKSRTFELPAGLKAKATWLVAGDSKTAIKLLAAAEEEEAKVRTSYISVEFKRIEALLNNLENAVSINHTIELPQGSIRIHIPIAKPGPLAQIFGGNKMSNGRKDLVPREELQSALAEKQRRGNLLNINLDSLTPKQQTGLMERILDERIKLDASQAAADNRFTNSTRDMANTIRAVNSLEQSSKSDYDVRSRFETASGTTDIHVKKNNNTVIIVVAIVIGIFILAMMS